MTVYVELIADDVDDIAEYLGQRLIVGDASVELLPNGDCYLSLDLRVRVVDDATGRGHPRPLVEVFGELPDWPD